MPRKSAKTHPSIEALSRVRAELESLIQAANEKKLSATVRNELDAAVRGLVDQIGGFLRDLDPIKQPSAVFDPSDPAVVGRFVAMAMISQPRVPLPAATDNRFYGSGIYALYYMGDHESYAPISSSETPIYVGKADPATDAARTPREQGDKLISRLREHLRSIKKAVTTLSPEEFEYRCLVVQSGWQGAAEAYLISLFSPVWNNETKICFGIGKHGDKASTRSNLRSPWDTMHPGRGWAHGDVPISDAKSIERIRSELDDHFRTEKVYYDVDEILREFLEQLRQI